METLVGLLMGIALAAACGFRVFIPMLVLSAASKAGLVHLADGFNWMSSWPALIGLSTAAVLELGAAHWPWLDHALDVVATPCAVVAGTLVAASQLHGMDPGLAWAAGLVAGGGSAAATQTANVSTRGASTVTTAGLLNPVLNAIQSAVAGVLSVLAIVVPVIAGMLVLGVAAAIVRWWWVGRAARLAAGRDSHPVPHAVAG